MEGSKIFQSPRDERRVLVFWVFVVSLTVLLATELADYRFSQVRGADNANYVLLARSMAEGQGFSDVHIPGHPPHTRYPPLLPLLLSPVYYFFGYNFTMMRLLVVLAGIGSIYAVKLLFERESDGTTGVLVALMTVTNFYVLFYMREIMTEIPYMLFSLLALLWLGRFSEERAFKPSATAAVVLVTAAYLTRSIGVTIYMAGLCLLLVKLYSGNGERRLHAKKLLFFGVLAILPFLIWSLRSSLYADPAQSYFSIFFQGDYYNEESARAGVVTFFERFRYNTNLYLDTLYRPFITYVRFKTLVPTLVVHASSLFFLAIVLWGLFYRVWTKRGVSDFYLIIYLALLCVWPTYGTGDVMRYLVPVIPFLYFYFLIGVACMARLGAGARASGPSGKMFILIPCAFFFFFLSVNLVEIRAMVWPPALPGNLRSSTEILSANLFKRVDKVELDMVTSEYFMNEVPCYHKYLERAHIVGEISVSGEVIMARKPEMAAIVSGRHSVGFPFSSDTSKIYDVFNVMGVDYIVLDSCYEETREYLAPFITEHIELFEVWRDDDGDMAILRRKEGF
jgi:4-amino-4-deoxy-L-arabinose transferase-like glycosyltransferase